jgi:arsenate reductase (thioredoxin)
VTGEGIGASIDRGTRASGPGDRPIRVLFVCTHNSARSVMAEVLLRHRGGPAFEVRSAGTEPGGVNPMTLRVLGEAGFETADLRSKSVSEFLEQRFDYVITVCDSARQVCPVFPGEGHRLHWGYDDPSAATGGDEQRLAVFRRVFTAISERIGLFVPIALRARAEGELEHR